MTVANDLWHQNVKWARAKWGGQLSATCLKNLQTLSEQFRFSVLFGDLLILGNNWYVTHSGLLRLANRIVAWAFTSDRPQDFAILPLHDGHLEQRCSKPGRAKDS